MTGPVVPGAALDTGSAGSRPPLRVGLVGSGPWAAVFHAPMLAAGPHTILVGIWSRRPQPAADLARQHGARAFDRYEDLLSTCEAVAFAVAPDAQAELAPVAAAAGRHLLLEKPLALDLAGAEALAAAVEKAGVISQVVLTQRYTPVMREFLVRAADIRPEAARCASISGAALAGGMFATPWRLAEGALLDIGPHILDLLQAAVGPITEISADG
ncbi:MAG TPA: Gfo/Idh/MocA family oxidoreductase, partial [Acidimicrobiales bacterium]|nr:Gfo/Idh/MocA family oxidoreductase [Acidimicrobiales bacterium]